jgi:DNA polymerase III epsilon subunit family exonuclease
MDEVIEIAAIRVIDNKIDVYETLIKPKNPIPPFTTDIHGITDEMVADSRSIEEVLPEFLEFASGYSWVAHNSKFDVGFIVFNMHQSKIDFFDTDVFCSCKLSRKLVKGSENHKLNTLAQFFDIKLENHHRALDDTVACLKIFAQTLKKVVKEKDFKEGRLMNIQDFKKTLEVDIPKNLKGIQKYLENQTPIEIKYKGGTMKGQFRPIRPVSLLPLPQGNVLYAHCLTSDIYKSFSLKKIVEYRELEQNDSKDNE